MASYVIYADGACLGNPGTGGWGAVIVEPADKQQELSGGPFEGTTNNRMEITAAIEGLRATEPDASVILRTDSEYVVKTMTLGWKRRANLDLWEELDREVAGRNVRFEWVRGHAGDANNERADRLAGAAASKKPRKVFKPQPVSEEQGAFQEIEKLLREGESIRECEACGRPFIAESIDSTHCSQVACQLRARRQ
jgi:ribonuclease HI